MRCSTTSRRACSRSGSGSGRPSRQGDRPAPGLGYRQAHAPAPVPDAGPGRRGGSRPAGRGPATRAPPAPSSAPPDTATSSTSSAGRDRTCSWSAGTATRGVGRHQADAAPVGADRRQAPPGPHAPSEPLVERPAVRLGARIDHEADAGRRGRPGARAGPGAPPARRTDRRREAGFDLVDGLSVAAFHSR
jgi:hypothetical protein